MMNRIRPCSIALLIVGLTAGPAFPADDGVIAVPATKFLDSIGVNAGIAGRGETLDRTIECARYLGIRWFRAGIEGNIPIRDFVELHRRAGVRFS